MSFLSKLFSRGLSRDTWYVKVDLLTELSEIARRHWIQEWTGGLPRSHPERGSAMDESGSRLDERGHTALRALQARLTTLFIRQHTYLAAEDQGDFAGLLLGNIVGEQTPTATALLQRYAEVDDDLQTLFARVADDLAAGFGKDAPGAARIRETLPQFTVEHHYITALCFGDAEMVRTLKAQIETADESAADMAAR